MWRRNDLSPDYLYIADIEIENFEKQGLKIIRNYKKDIKKADFLFFKSLNEYLNAKNHANRINFILLTNNTADFKVLKNIRKENKVVFVLSSENNNQPIDKRTFIHQLIRLKIDVPLVSFNSYEDTNREDFQIKATLDNGLLLIDGLLDGIVLHNVHNKLLQESVKTAFGILQASRSRVTKTEYISCPSCGRTLFDIQEVTKEIKEKTAHLKGVKIGIMGCIVNGPGEMADADYGYVGTGPGLVSLYKGQNIIKKNIAYKNAVEELITLIKEDDNWVG
jgi:(E)-4-hydroxy-3-methylbut-2-enyl-diphosphate synthase